MKKRKIMITNDDGIQSEGLRAAVMAAKKFGEVIVVAPARQQTAMGRAYPRTEDLGIIRKVDYSVEGVEAYAVNGSPGYCTAFGLLEILDISPDLVISGINFGCNLGLSLTCSGTLGAAFEASSEGVPVMAVSLETKAEHIMVTSSASVGFQKAKEVTEIWIARMLEEIYEKDNDAYRFLNINIPAGDIDTENYRMTFLENQNYYVLQRPPKREWSQPCGLSFTIEVDEENLHKGSDIQTVCQDRIVSVTPVTMDMTRNTMSRF
nr:5'/3'-nucleotidase SurE [uncultured Blautia sp.]